MVTKLDQAAPWLLRLAWAALILATAPAIGGALGDNSRPVQVVGTTLAWAVWAAGLLASLVPSCTSLTVLRMLAPMPLVAAVGAGPAGATSEQVAAGSIVGLVAVLVAFSGEIGGVFVQGSAYGDERRFALRPPGALLALLPILWIVVAGSAVAGPLLLGARSWISGILLTVVAGAGAIILGPRFHRLSNRWLVFVPAGAVVHDQLVLDDTAMFRSDELAGAGLAPAGTEAADLTGNALGTAIELRLVEPGSKVVLAATAEHPTGRGLHVRSILVSPSRPGRAVAEARRRGIPV